MEPSGNRSIEGSIHFTQYLIYKTPKKSSDSSRIGEVKNQSSCCFGNLGSAACNLLQLTGLATYIYSLQQLIKQLLMVKLAAKFFF